MARAEVPDTSLLITRMRARRAWLGLQASIAAGRFWLSSVAIAELYAGTRSRQDAELLDRFVAVMQRLDRLLIPTADEWRTAGQLLARRVRLFGPLRPRDHLADVLILVSAARIGGTVVTANVRHFAMWQSLAVAAGLDVTVTSVPQP